MHCQWLLLIRVAVQSQTNWAQSLEPWISRQGWAGEAQSVHWLADWLCSTSVCPWSWGPSGLHLTVILTTYNQGRTWMVCESEVRPSAWVAPSHVSGLTHEQLLVPSPPKDSHSWPNTMQSMCHCPQGMELCWGRRDSGLVCQDLVHCLLSSGPSPGSLTRTWDAHSSDFFLSITSVHVVILFLFCVAETVGG